jgi:hypothetical protein
MKKKKAIAKPPMIIVERCGLNAKTEAQNVRRFRYKGFRMFAHVYGFESKWRVSEYTTGHYIPQSFAETRAKAIEQAKAEIDRVGVSGATEAINRMIIDRGIANVPRRTKAEDRS